MFKADRVNSTEIIVDWWVVRGWEEEGLLDQNSECDALENIKSEKCSESMPLHQSSRLGRC